MAVPTTKLTATQAIKRGRQIITNHPTYSMEARGSAINSPCHDCSSFVGTCWDLPSRPATAVMKYYYTMAGPQWGFISIPVPMGGITSWKDLKKGDVLVMHRNPGEPGHTCMYIGDGQIMQMCLAGALTRPFYLTDGVPWTEVLRGRGGISIASWTPSDNIHDGF